MIRKYIENTEEVRQRLIRMLMDDASDMCRYQRDIYMYIDEDGHAQLDWFINVDGNSWIDDDHILLHVCLKHYEGIECIEDAASDYADQADEIMRRENRFRLDEAYRQEITDIVPIVWLFVLTAEDQLRYELQGGENNDKR